MNSSTHTAGRTRATATAAAPIVLLISLVACTGLLLSERERVVHEAHEAVCRASDYKAMRPFLSKGSVPLLDLSTSLTSLTQAVTGSALADYIATQCHSGEQTVVDEIRVNDDRYIVRTKTAQSDRVSETVVVREDGAWKISLLGR